MLESKLHKENCFLTLTYNDENLPKNNSLKKRDCQLFIKRLRKKVSPLKIRYFLAGEYGGRKGRPHYHMILFGYLPKDLKYLKQTKKEEFIYTSEEIEKLWGKGFISVGINMNINSLKYVAKYLSKLSDFNPITQDPPFSTQSNRRGIGAGAFDLSMYETDGIYLEGRKWKIPRYFDKLAEEMGYDLTKIKEKRDAKVKSYNNTFPTLQEKEYYADFVKKQGYSTNHLFTPSPKNHIRDFLDFDSDGVADFETYEYNLNEYFKWKNNTFFETWPYVPPPIIPIPPKKINYEQMEIFDKSDPFNIKINYFLNLIL